MTTKTGVGVEGPFEFHPEAEIKAKTLSGRFGGIRIEAPGMLGKKGIN